MSEPNVKEGYCQWRDFCDWKADYIVDEDNYENFGYKSFDEVPFESTLLVFFIRIIILCIKNSGHSELVWHSDKYDTYPTNTRQFGSRIDETIGYSLKVSFLLL